MDFLYIIVIRAWSNRLLSFTHGTHLYTQRYEGVYIISGALSSLSDADDLEGHMICP